jgi:hypothetical protein
VSQAVGVLAPSLFEGIRQNRKPVEGPLLVDAVGHLANDAVIPGQPNRLEGGGAEGVAEDVPD